MAAAAPATLRTGFAQTQLANGPRIFLTPARLEQAKIWKDGPLALAWKRMHARCDKFSKGHVVAYKGPESPTDELLYQRDVGNSLPTLAMGYLMSGNSDYKNFAFEQARVAAAYPDWGGPGPEKEGKDLAAGHLLLGIALLLDWLGDEMDAKTRTLLIDTLKHRGAQMAVGSETVFWSKTLLQNHLWVNMTGLLTAGLALQRYDTAVAHPFIVTAAQRMQPCFPVLAEDGSDQEGPAYWTYGAEYLLKYQHLATELLGMKVDSPWFHKTAEYYIAMTLPLDSVAPRASIFDMADSTLVAYYGPEYLLRRLASLNKDTAAQEMADRLEAVNAVLPPADWLNFIWFDPSVAAQGLSALPPLQHFPDLDLVIARSDRSGRESAVVMRAGPPLGKRVQAMHIDHDIGTAHTHPDINHIILFGGGEFLLVDNGYTSIKDTFQHNTLVVNGKQQVGGGAQWTKWPSYPVPDPQPSMKALTAQATYDYWVGEGAAAYPASVELTRFDRHVLFVKPNALLVVDDIATSSDADFQLFWHPSAAPSGDEKSGFTSKIGHATLLTRFMLPPDTQVTTGERSCTMHSAPPTILHEIALKTKGRAIKCASIFTWGTDGARPPAVEVSEANGIWTLRHGNNSFALDLKQRSIATA
jgi:hypothetical protein